MGIRTIIIDDEAPARERLRGLLDAREDIGMFAGARYEQATVCCVREPSWSAIRMGSQNCVIKQGKNSARSDWSCRMRAAGTIRNEPEEGDTGKRA